MVQTRLKFVNRAQAKKETGISYLGGVNTSSKLEKNGKKGISTFVLYLAPNTMSGYNVCPKASADCIAACLNNSGRNRFLDVKRMIEKARLAKTKMFFENRDFFVNWLVAEIRSQRAKAIRLGNGFSVRLNGTSDLSPELFKVNGKNLLELFPNVQFYDYTKVLNRTRLKEKYGNYDLTFSYSGYNMNECEEALENGLRVAMVFEKVPAFYKGYPVVNGDESDLRYFDPESCIVGLKFKKVREKIDFTKQQFVITKDNPDCIY